MLFRSYNVNFHPDNFNPKLTEYANIYKPLMDDHFPRWSGWWNVDGGVNNVRNYLTDIRGEMTTNYLPKYFGSGIHDIANIGISSSNLRTITVNTGAAASIKLNTVTVASGWSGSYYSGIAIPITAIVPSGYKFDGWDVINCTVSSSAATTTVTIESGNATITAKFSPD